MTKIITVAILAAFTVIAAVSITSPKRSLLIDMPATAESAVAVDAPDA